MHHMLVIPDTQSLSSGSPTLLCVHMLQSAGSQTPHTGNLAVETPKGILAHAAVGTAKMWEETLSPPISGTWGSQYPGTFARA